MKKPFIKSIPKYCTLYVIPFLLIGPAVLAQGPGASTPFKSIEAESGSLSGGASVRTMASLPSQPTPELEASGRSFAALEATNAAVSWTNNTGINANTIVVRASIPDAPQGGGITATLDLYVDGVFRQAITFTSKYSWQYGVAQDWADNDPSHGIPHRYWDESRAWIQGAPIAPGSTIMFKKSASNTAAFYYLDMFDLENVGAAKTQPANSLSITSFGAISGDDIDDSDEIIACINACQQQKKEMWIPAGTFHTSKIINASGITISGAGMWYSNLYRIIGARHKWSLTNCTLRDIYVFGNETARDLAHGHDYGFTIQGANGWLVERVWLHNVGAGFWCSGTDGTIKDSRCSNDWADGINLNNGSSVQTDNAGLRLTAQNNYVRGSADDGIAINAQNGGGTAANMVDTKVLNNSSVATIYANGIRVAGGRNSLIQYNYVSDNADLSGIVLGTFGTAGNPCESVQVKNNTLVRCGGFRSTIQGAIFINNGTTGTVQQNLIVDASNKAVAIAKFNVNVVANVVVHPRLTAFYINPGAVGTASINYNTAVDLNAGQLPFKNDATTTFTPPTLVGNSWQQTNTDVTFYQNPIYEGVASQIIPVGNYTAAQLATLGVPNDWASSVRVPDGRQLIMYSGDNFTGTSWTIDYDTPSFKDLAPNANDQMSSCKIMAVTPAAMFSRQTAPALKQEKVTQAAHFNIYPNPVGALLHVNGVAQASHARITDLQGKQLVSCSTNGTIDVSMLQPGIYFLSIDHNTPVKFIKSSN
ncbi:T9SS type A sorting domain-containing protein [Chitinophaga agrisoli]|uniref:T9SS type A sorting domain-containing protein n=1 Tax=Chitinophaga agrisoli TaxID=2607653 RepID=A0A5B2VST5_9BACT|nr:T9SS type A sorting domain-containing protein [Chitinophaga agrisoli]KAA2241317.1 T9SS type A sorting domain-containing protein [Chitinophaga agrisoli]